MVTRKRLTALTVGLTVGLLAQHAAGAGAPVVMEQQTPATAELVVDARVFRIELDSYVRELDRQIRATLNDAPRREPNREVELARNELRTQI